MFRLKNPLPEQIRDDKKLTSFYKGLKLVPYATWSSYSGHKFLKLLLDLAQLSGTHGSCINDLCKWAFGGEINLVRSSIPGLKREVETLSGNEEIRLAQEIEALGIRVIDIPRISKKLFASKKKTGCEYLLYREMTAGGSKRVKLEVISPRDIMFLDTEDDEPQAVAISPDWFQGTLIEEPKVVRVYPDFSGTEGNRETIIYRKHEDEDSLVYGRPDTLHVLHYMAAEFHQSAHFLKTATTDTVAKLLLAMENPDPASLRQGESLADAIKENRRGINDLTSNKGQYEEVDGIGVIGFPFEGQPPTAIKLDVDRDSDWAKVATATASDFIASAHGWDKVLLGFDKPSGSLGGNLMIDTFNARNTSTIKPIQREYESEVWGTVFRLLSEFSGVREIGTIAPQFEDRVKSLVESLGGGNNTNGGSIDDTDGNGSQAVGGNG